MELQLHPPVLVCPNFFPTFADDDRGLRPVHKRFHRCPLRAKWIATRDGDKLDDEPVLRALAHLSDLGRLDLYLSFYNRIFRVFALPRMLGQVEQLARVQFAVITRASEPLKTRLQLF